MWAGMFLGAGIGFGLLLLALGVLWGRLELDSYAVSMSNPAADRFDLGVIAANVDARLLAAAIVLAGVVGVVSGWPALGYGALVAVYGIPVMLRSDGSVTDYAAKTEQIAAWVEDIRAAINAGALLESAVRSATASAGPQLRPDLLVLVGELEHGVPLREALINLAENVDHRIMDQVVAVMVLVSDGGGAAVSEVLADLATNCREMTSAALQIHAARASNRTQTRMMLLASLLLLVTFSLLARDLVAAYQTGVGQFVLAFLITGFGGVFFWISRLSSHRAPARVLSPEGLR